MAHTLRCSANHATFLRAYLIERNLTVSLFTSRFLTSWIPNVNVFVLYRWKVEDKTKIEAMSVENYLFIKLKAM